MRLETPILSTALCKSSRILQSRILGEFAGFLFYQRLVQKLKNSAKPNSWDGLPVLALELGNLFPNSAQAEFGGFDSQLLVRSGFFRCQSRIRRLWLTAFGKAKLFRCQSRILGLWLTVFGKAKLFGCQSRSFRQTFWLPLQPLFAKGTAFFFAKAQNSRIRQSRILGTVCRFPPWNVFPPLKPAICVPNSAQAEFGGFGLRPLVSRGFLGAKAVNRTGVLISEFSVS